MPRRKAKARSADCCTIYDESAMLVQLYLRPEDRNDQVAKAAEILEASNLHGAVQAALDKGCPEECPDYQMMQQLAKIIAPVDAGGSPTQWSPPNGSTLRRSPRLPEKRSDVGVEPHSKRQRNNFAQKALTPRRRPKSSTEDAGPDVEDAIGAVYPIVKDLFDNMQATGEQLEWPLVLQLFKLALSPRTEQHLSEFGDVLRELAKDLPELLPTIDECCGRAEAQDEDPQEEESENHVASSQIRSKPKPRPRKPDVEEDHEEEEEESDQEEARQEEAEPSERSGEEGLEAISEEAEKDPPPLMTPPRTPPLVLDLPPSPPHLPTGPLYKRNKNDYYLPAFYKQNHTTYFHSTNQLSVEDLGQLLEHGFVQINDVVMSWTGDLPRPTAHLECWDEVEAAALARFMERQVSELSPVDPGQAFDSALRQLVAMRGARPVDVAAKVRKVRRLAEGNALLTDLAEGKLMYYENSLELEAALEEEAATAKKTKKRLLSWVSEHKTLFERAQKYPRLFAICVSKGYIMKYTLVMLAVCDKFPGAFSYDKRSADDDLCACPPLLQEVLRKE